MARGEGKAHTPKKLEQFGELADAISSSTYGLPSVRDIDDLSQSKDMRNQTKKSRKDKYKMIKRRGTSVERMQKNAKVRWREVEEKLKLQKGLTNLGS